jgi:hypothetical protein
MKNLNAAAEMQRVLRVSFGEIVFCHETVNRFAIPLSGSEIRWKGVEMSVEDFLSQFNFLNFCELNELELEKGKSNNIDLNNWVAITDFHKIHEYFTIQCLECMFTFIQKGTKQELIGYSVITTPGRIHILKHSGTHQDHRLFCLPKEAEATFTLDLYKCKCQGGGIPYSGGPGAGFII